MFQTRYLEAADIRIAITFMLEERRVSTPGVNIGNLIDDLLHLTLINNDRQLMIVNTEIETFITAVLEVIHRPGITDEKLYQEIVSCSPHYVCQLNNAMLIDIFVALDAIYDRLPRLNMKRHGFDIDTEHRHIKELGISVLKRFEDYPPQRTIELLDLLASKSISFFEPQGTWLLRQDIFGKEIKAMRARAEARIAQLGAEADLTPATPVNPEDSESARRAPSPTTVDTLSQAQLERDVLNSIRL